MGRLIIGRGNHIALLCWTKLTTLMIRVFNVQVTVDLDVLVRDDLLSFLKADSEARGATILCEASQSHIRV